MKAKPAKSENLVAENLAFVKAIAGKIKEQLPPEIEFDELVSYGNQGLAEAAQRFDDGHGAQFTTFAYYRVRGAIYDGLRRMGWLPRGQYTRQRIEERTNSFLGNLAETEAEGKPSKGASQPSLEDSVRDLAGALSGVAAIFVTSLELQDSTDVADDSPLPHERLEHHQTAGVLKESISSLPEKERRLLELYYFEDKTLEESGVALGLSKSWASRLHARAITLLRSNLAKTSS